MFSYVYIRGLGRFCVIFGRYSCFMRNVFVLYFDFFNVDVIKVCLLFNGYFWLEDFYSDFVFVNGEGVS